VVLKIQPTILELTLNQWLNPDWNHHGLSQPQIILLGLDKHSVGELANLGDAFFGCEFLLHFLAGFSGLFLDLFRVSYGV
jgi:hypothetical protein